MSSLAALRRKLLALPGFSVRPSCPRCLRVTDPERFASSGQCVECAAEVAELEATMQQIDRRLLALWAAACEAPQSPADEAEQWRLECSRYEINLLIHPENAREASDARD